MIEARKHFRFYSHIYSNFFSIDEISTDRFKEITGIKEIVRIKWADMESKYLLIPNELKWVLIRIKKLPKQHDLELILGTFMAIHHTTIVYHTKESKEESGHTDLVERRKQIEEIQTFLKLYI